MEVLSARCFLDLLTDVRTVLSDCYRDIDLMQIGKLLCLSPAKVETIL